MMISHISHSSPVRLIGVESYHGFGDCCFNAPLLKALSTLSNGKVGVAVKPQCADAFHNLPWVDEIIPIKSMGDGEKALSRLRYRQTYQITQNAWFNTFRERDPNHSLIDTPTAVAAELKLPTFNPKPIYIISESESLIVKPVRPTIAIESVYYSQQSWATEEAFDMIKARYRDTHNIIMLSDHSIPRRSLIPILQHVETLFSVGSGYFCATLGLPTELQPPRIVCLWNDAVYRYEHRLATLGWCRPIVWVHNLFELEEILCGNK